jgi:two-component sensor histidine kinase
MRGSLDERANGVISKGLGFNIVENLAGQTSVVVTFSGEAGMTMRIVFPSDVMRDT